MEADIATSRRESLAIESLHRGDRVDHYRVEGLVARGGMASIFRAVDLHTRACVAIKAPHPEFECDVLFFDRFRREAEIGRMLDHPGVVKVFPKGDSNRVCMIMEWVEGRPLREILEEEKRLTPERAVRILLRICEAVEHIHSRGVIHRDLKPDNIMVDAEDQIKVMDFGIAKEGRGRRLTFAKLTKSMGTPDYISPELVKGKRGDTRSDVYSLGVMLYEMVAGEVPFRAPNALAAMNQRLLTKAVLPRQVEQTIPSDLRGIIYRALEREPQNRYATIRDLVWDLEHPAEVRAASHSTTRLGDRPRESKSKMVWAYAGLALIPAIIFALLFLVAHRQ